MQFSVLEIILLIIGAVLIVITMMQSSKSDGASGALMGGGLNLFNETKERGIDKLISQVTLYSGIAFLVIAIILKMA